MYYSNFIHLFLIQFFFLFKSTAGFKMFDNSYLYRRSMKISCLANRYSRLVFMSEENKVPKWIAKVASVRTTPFWLLSEDLPAWFHNDGLPDWIKSLDRLPDWLLKDKLPRFSDNPEWESDPPQWILMTDVLPKWFYEVEVVPLWIKNIKDVVPQWIFNDDIPYFMKQRMPPEWIMNLDVLPAWMLTALDSSFCYSWLYYIGSEVPKWVTKDVIPNFVMMPPLYLLKLDELPSWFYNVETVPTIVDHLEKLPKWMETEELSPYPKQWNSFSPPSWTEDLTLLPYWMTTPGYREELPDWMTYRRTVPDWMLENTLPVAISFWDYVDQPKTWMLHTNKLPQWMYEYDSFPDWFLSMEVVPKWIKKDNIPSFPHYWDNEGLPQWILERDELPDWLYDYGVVPEWLRLYSHVPSWMLENEIPFFPSNWDLVGPPRWMMAIDKLPGWIYESILVDQWVKVSHPPKWMMKDTIPNFPIDWKESGGPPSWIMDLQVLPSWIYDLDVVPQWLTLNSCDGFIPKWLLEASIPNIVCEQWIEKGPPKSLLMMDKLPKWLYEDNIPEFPSSWYEDGLPKWIMEIESLPKWMGNLLGFSELLEFPSFSFEWITDGPPQWMMTIDQLPKWLVSANNIPDIPESWNEIGIPRWIMELERLPDWISESKIFPEWLSFDSREGKVPKWILKDSLPDLKVGWTEKGPPKWITELDILPRWFYEHNIPNFPDSWQENGPPKWMMELESLPEWISAILCEIPGLSSDDCNESVPEWLLDNTIPDLFDESEKGNWIEEGPPKSIMELDVLPKWFYDDDKVPDFPESWQENGPPKWIMSLDAIPQWIVDHLSEFPEWLSLDDCNGRVPQWILDNTIPDLFDDYEKGNWIEVGPPKSIMELEDLPLWFYEDEEIPDFPESWQENGPPKWIMELESLPEWISTDNLSEFPEWLSLENCNGRVPQWLLDDTIPDLFDDYDKGNWIEEGPPKSIMELDVLPRWFYDYNIPDFPDSWQDNGPPKWIMELESLPEWISTDNLDEFPEWMSLDDCNGRVPQWILKDEAPAYLSDCDNRWIEDPPPKSIMELDVLPKWFYNYNVPDFPASWQENGPPKWMMSLDAIPQWIADLDEFPEWLSLENCNGRLPQWLLDDTIPDLFNDYDKGNWIEEGPPKSIMELDVLPKWFYEDDELPDFPDSWQENGPPKWIMSLDAIPQWIDDFDKIPEWLKFDIRFNGKVPKWILKNLIPSFSDQWLEKGPPEWMLKLDFLPHWIYNFDEVPDWLTLDSYDNNHLPVWMLKSTIPEFPDDWMRKGPPKWLFKLDVLPAWFYGLPYFPSCVIEADEETGPLPWILHDNVPRWLKRNDMPDWLRSLNNVPTWMTEMNELPLWMQEDELPPWIWKVGSNSVSFKGLKEEGGNKEEK